jgi:hypothetical protein
VKPFQCLDRLFGDPHVVCGPHSSCPWQSETAAVLVPRENWRGPPLGAAPAAR